MMKIPENGTVKFMGNSIPAEEDNMVNRIKHTEIRGNYAVHTYEDGETETVPIPHISKELQIASEDAYTTSICEPKAMTAETLQEAMNALVLNEKMMTGYMDSAIGAMGIPQKYLTEIMGAKTTVRQDELGAIKTPCEDQYSHYPIHAVPVYDDTAGISGGHWGGIGGTGQQPYQRGKRVINTRHSLMDTKALVYGLEVVDSNGNVIGKIKGVQPKGAGVQLEIELSNPIQSKAIVLRGEHKDDEV